MSPETALELRHAHFRRLCRYTTPKGDVPPRRNTRRIGLLARVINFLSKN